MKSQTENKSSDQDDFKISPTCTLDQLIQNNYSPKSLNFQDYYFLGDDHEIIFLEISPNEQMLAFGGHRRNQVIILNIFSKKIMKELTFDNNIWICKFSNDSNFIFFGDQVGQLYQFDILQDFKEIYKHKVHNNWFNDLKIINSEQIVSCTNDKQIIVTDIKNKQQLLKVRDAHQGDINQLEYYSVNKMIISCSDDRSIKFFLMNGNIFINQQNAHNDSIYQTQLTNNNRNLISRSDKQFKKWKINNQKQELKQIQTQIEKEQLQSFYFAQNYAILIKIYSNYLLILNNSFKIIKKQKHKIEEFYCIFYSNQPASLNYLLIQGSQRLQVLKRIL